jgi:hypothetical protein
VQKVSQTRTLASIYETILCLHFQNVPTFKLDSQFLTTETIFISALEKHTHTLNAVSRNVCAGY